MKLKREINKNPELETGESQNPLLLPCDWDSARVRKDRIENAATIGPCAGNRQGLNQLREMVPLFIGDLTKKMATADLYFRLGNCETGHEGKT